MNDHPYQNSHLADAPQYLKVKLLSPVFIGSGHYLGRDMDWIVQKGNIRILDSDKLMQLIGPKRMEAFMHYISTGLNQQGRKMPLDEFLGNFGIRDLDKVTHSAIKPFQNFDSNLLKKSKDLHQAIRSGNGAPLLPGSSLKGSLRTAYAVHRMAQIPEEPQSAPQNIKNNKGQYADAGLENALFTKPDIAKGKAPNYDLFRLVQLGDLQFQKSAVGPAPVVSFLEGKFDYRSDLATTLLEYLEPGQEAYTRLKVQGKLQKTPQGHFPQEETLTAEHLLSIAHRHTRSQLLQEIDFFRENEESLPTELPELMPGLINLDQQSYNFAEGEYLLRVGAGSGFRGTTGGWHEDYWDKSDYKKLAKQSRHGGDKGGENPNLPFPRSRKLGPQGEALGYVKISLVTTEEYQEYLRAQDSSTPQKPEESQSTPAAPKADGPLLKYVAADKTIGEGDFLHAEVVDPRQKPPLAKVYLQEGETALIPMSGYNNAEKGMTCQVMVVQIVKRTGEIRMVKFKNPL